MNPTTESATKLFTELSPERKQLAIDELMKLLNEQDAEPYIKPTKTDLKLEDLKRKSRSNYSKALAKQFSSEKLMQLLGVSYPTARRYKRGDSDMRKGEITLIELILEKRIIPNEWPRNITFERDGMMHLSKYNLNWGQLEHFSWVCQRWGDTLHSVQTLKSYVGSVINNMTELQKAKAMQLQTAMIQSIETGQPYELTKKTG